MDTGDVGRAGYLRHGSIIRADFYRLDELTGELGSKNALVYVGLVEIESILSKEIGHLGSGACGAGGAIEASRPRDDGISCSS